MTAAAYYQQGRIALTAGDLESAQRHFAQSLLHDPAYLDALNGMAAILTVQGRYQESLHLLQQAVARAPDDKMYQRNIVRVEQLILHAGTETPPPQTGSHAEVLAGAVPSVRTLLPVPPSPFVLPRSAPAASAEPDTEGGVATVVELAPNIYSLRPAPSSLAAKSLPALAATSPTSAVLPVASAPTDSAPRLLRDQDRRAALPASSTSAAAVIPADPPRPAAPGMADAVGRTIPSDALTSVSYAAPSKVPVRLMISNGMGRGGWAMHHADLLMAEGIRPVRITNYRHYQVKQTMILFRNGQRAQADRIKESLPFTVDVVEARELPEGIDVQLILGGDSQAAGGGLTV